MTKPFDPTKPVQTRSGLEARLFLDCPGEGVCCFIGAIKCRDGAWVSACWAEDGRRFPSLSESHSFDLVNVPERVSGWMNLYHVGQIYQTKERADKVASGNNRIACIYVEFEEGEGLN